MSNPIPLAPVGARHRLIRLDDGGALPEQYLSELDRYIAKRAEARMPQAPRHPLSDPEFVWNPPRTLPSSLFGPT